MSTSTFPFTPLPTPTSSQTFDPFMFKLERNQSIAVLIDISLIISCFSLVMVIGLIVFRCLHRHYWTHQRLQQDSQLDTLNNLTPDSLP